MNLTAHAACDVLVIGAGLAGIRAALTAAAEGRTVILASSANIFSGSSFFPGTWGFGLIGPENQADEADLAATIERIGCDMADPKLVQTFVSGIQPAIAEIKAQGIHLHRAANANEREFIPCFDHKHRDWNRIEAENARTVFAQRIAELGIETRPFCELLEIVVQDGLVRGAVVHEDGQIRLIACGALVLASGGFGGLFKHRLTSDDVSGSVQSIALRSGAELVNLEFMQIMPGYLSPIYKIVFNEKTFRFAQLMDSFDLPLLLGMDQGQDLLDERAGYGPFTSRLKSRLVDLALFKAQQADPSGVTVTYTQDMIEHPPELIRTYFEWMAKAKHLSMSEPAKIGLFAHAANGGIRIDTTAATRVPGLFACGEATGGMHGADRIGGLSTANGLVFGGIAGRSAAQFAAENPVQQGLGCTFEATASTDLADMLTELRELMYRAALVIRTKKGLEQALAQIDQITGRLQATVPSTSLTEKPADAKSLAASCRLKDQLMTARAILTAATLRCESRGSHFRGDHPEQDPAQSSPIVVSLQGGSIQVRFHPLAGT
ncbi:MAG: FAD-binding protein [Clostridia bacterium]|nr:FAD-binding protein [Clostridia bacterium]NCC77196.1 FAD-binding protein [Clostridia bacterium]